MEKHTEAFEEPLEAPPTGEPGTQIVSDELPLPAKTMPRKEQDIFNRLSTDINWTKIFQTLRDLKKEDA
ncbi:hypothetical protein LTR02_017451 [Friedmanniomyces endolithicus]|uniref:Uncharacterized protein n=1 Tax=Friedmanniomyces endolithicus TaxID=329885 RepID=A0AAN6IZL9_9PEZI|nr:hypothetical protein LTR35_018049 [Friedmanniomyces endolithicus]KAK0301818.1 hypothetical protein LTR82_018108 [Friedmanniomyces endolithicus]KAK0333253.1 hypothetical protein LTR94_021565 [Friedmanniomyces endolithicus]KAK0768984.1 hypothetical protein LTR59_017300 [Friedmanniomyces endolithicus]KAK0772002.1 hypothetical protein LTR38_017031 [Friedmanniomyces endolithicus]